MEDGLEGGDTWVGVGVVFVHVKAGISLVRFSQVGMIILQTVINKRNSYPITTETLVPCTHNVHVNTGSSPKLSFVVEMPLVWEAWIIKLDGLMYEGFCPLLNSCENSARVTIQTRCIPARTT